MKSLFSWLLLVSCLFLAQTPKAVCDEMWNVDLVGEALENWVWSKDMSLFNNHLFVATKGKGVAVLDVSDQTCPVHIGSIRSDIYFDNTAIHNNFGYFSTSDSLLIYDISYPTNPVHISTHDFSIYDILIHDDYAFLSGNTFSVLDISNPYDLDVVGSCDTLSRMFDIHGDYIYYSGMNELGILDISDISEPTNVHYISYDNDYIHNVHVFVNALYVSVDGSTDVYDISDPIDPEFVTTIYDYEIEEFVYQNTTGIFSTGYTGLRVVDLSNPLFPETIAIYDDYIGSDKMILFDNTLFTLYSSIKISIFNAEDLNDIDYIGEYINGRVFDVEAHGDYAYVACGLRGFNVLDISNPANPMLLYTMSRNIIDFTRNIIVDDNITYVFSDSLHVIDVSDGDNPVILSSILSSGSINDAILHNNMIYCVDNFDLLVYDVNDIQNPALIHQIGVGYLDSSGEIEVHADYLFICHGSPYEIHIYELNDGIPYYYSTEEYQFATMEVADNYIYGVTNSSVTAYEIGVDLELTEVGSLDIITGSGRDIEIYDDYAFISGGFTGTTICNVTNPYEMQYVGSYLSTHGDAHNVHFYEGLVYVADYISLLVLDPSMALPVDDVSRKLSPSNDMIQLVWPNPFNSQTSVSFYLSKPSPTQISMFNINGQKVMNMASQSFPSGQHTILIDASTFSSGQYFIRVEVPNGWSASHKITLIR